MRIFPAILISYFCAHCLPVLVGLLVQLYAFAGILSTLSASFLSSSFPLAALKNVAAALLACIGRAGHALHRSVHLCLCEWDAHPRQRSGGAMERRRESADRLDQTRRRGILVGGRVGQV